MNYRMIAFILSRVLLILAALMLLPLLTALVYGESVLPFLVTILVTAACGGVLLLFRPRSREIYAREGFTCVGLSWLAMSLLGSLPFVISGDIPRFVDAFFETVSGFTTTGASILNDIESLSRSGLFWRSFTHWIGGMGVLVFLMAVMPMSGERSMHIMRAEVPGPTVGKLVPRAKETARILYFIYTGFTVAETIFLMFGGMSFYEALLHAFATAGTGGFSTRNASIAAFDSGYIECVIAGFLVLFGMNFNLFYLMLIGRVREAFRSEELHRYLEIIAVCITLIVVVTASQTGFPRALRNGFFITMTTLSTAGFCTVDYTLWPAFLQTVIVLLMFIGGCAGSTGGGLKLSRVMLFIRTAAADVGRVVNPRRVNRVEMDGKRVTPETTGAVYAYVALVMLILLGCTALVSFDGYDFSTNFTAALSCISNVGPGLGKIGPSGNFSIFSSFSKIVMAITMLFGRLEIYAMLILFIPSTWKKR
ncbi:MAG: TrkH family potassium uptake protein [Oscillospiraceae bacterium]|nr:TrkH family potassium uptake protein [Oscillospiraceae bacterium]